MAQKRMFSKTITNSARFLKMPSETQSLYFHLGMGADDDGIVEAYSIMRATGSSEDNLKVLVAKGFIRVLNEDLVSFITDWHEHNLIRADRKVDSIYKDLLLKIIPEVELLEAKPRADTGKPTGRPMDGIGKVSIDKVRLGKDSKECAVKKKREFIAPTLEEVEKYVSGNNLNVDANYFLSYYGKLSWQDAYGNPIKNWKNKLRNCEEWPKFQKKKEGAIETTGDEAVDWALARQRERDKANRDSAVL